MSKVLIYLTGPCSVVGPGKENLTPNGSKVIGLLALIAMANGEFCSRVWLQDKLWSDRSEKQGQDSLRQAIKSLKQSLGAYSNCLVISGRNIALDRSMCEIDIFDGLASRDSLFAEQAEFLQGLDIRDREFNSWLIQMRGQLSKSKLREKRCAAAKGFVQSGFNIGLLPVRALDVDTDSQLIGNSLLARLGTALKNLGVFSVFDYSHGSQADNSHMGPDAMLSAQCYRLGQEFSLTLTLVRVIDKQVVWSKHTSLPSKEHYNSRICELVIHSCDQIANTLARPGILGPAERHQSARLVLGAIDKMFSIRKGSLDEADSELTRATELDQRGVYYAWHAYLLAFRSEEDKADFDRKSMLELTNDLADRALLLDRHNPLVLALLAHVYAFVFRDFRRAFSLIQPAMELGSDSLMVLDSYALFNFYTGNLNVARDAAQKALDASLFSPYRYCFETTLCMIETLSGDFEKASIHGENALAQHSPSQTSFYKPALRYLSAAQVKNGNVQRAQEVFQLLKLQEPEFHTTAIERDDYPIPNEFAQSVLRSSLKELTVT